ncbi:MAG TPA: sugar phosphate isomerase/epimerase [Acidimicrobiales bacterium]|nr:sugar phosphate isomerase/epimerase [Acidimicrobiales bacterium]
MTRHSAAAAVLWTGTVGFDRTVDERADVARAAGYESMSLSPREALTLQEQGVPLADAAKVVHDRGIGIAVLDAVFSWLRPGDTMALEGTTPVTVDEAVAIAGAMGIGLLNAIALRAEPMSREAIAERFAAFCDRAAEEGCGVALEFAPHSAVPDIGAAWDVVRLASRANGGVLFDSWHFFRGGADFETLRSVPGDRIFASQISDGTAQPVGHWFEETMHRRLLPGDGDFDLVAVVQVLAASGALARSGPEVISDAMHALSPVEAARVAAERCAVLWAAAGAGR